MAWTSTATCDVCGKVKGETNHWWMRLVDDVVFSLQPWEIGLEGNWRVKVYCGEGCAHKALGGWMAEQSKEASHAR